jgi:chromatin remodeling complex protein RSC6
MNTSETPVVIVAALPEKTVEASAPSKKGKSSKKSKTPEVLAEVAADVSESSVLVDASETIESLDTASDKPVVLCNISSKFAELEDMFQNINLIITGYKGKIKALEKMVNREMKSSKKVKKSGNKTPVGFERLYLISDELAEFFKVPQGTEMSRPMFSSELKKYVKENSLEEPTNKNKILPDDKLIAVFKLTPEKISKLTYFNIQKEMSSHLSEIKAAAIVEEPACETCDA